MLDIFDCSASILTLSGYAGLQHIVNSCDTFDNNINIFILLHNKFYYIVQIYWEPRYVVAQPCLHHRKF